MGAWNHLFRIAAFDAAKLGLVKRAGTSVDTHTASYAASGTSVIIRNVPFAFDTVDGALESVARLEFNRIRAPFATKGRSGHRPGATFTSSTAAQRTIGPPGPLANDAVNGAVVGVAVLGLRGARTSNAAMLGRRSRSSASLGTGTAGKSAIIPHTPFTNNTVNCTFEGVAVSAGSFHSS